MNLSLFQVVYGFNSRALIDLLPLPPSETTSFDAYQWSEFILKMHERTKLNIEKINEKYRIAGSKGQKKVKLEAAKRWIKVTSSSLFLSVLFPSWV
jgi:hypothetical protein